jgi:enamine deaminase RidA (YjgF/YER057c/UK114 family)
MDVAGGQDAAQRVALMLIAQLAQALDGDLSRLERVIKLGVFVNSAPSFTDQAKVANGASDLFETLFGDAGRHARAAVGVAVLPLGAAVEADAIVAVRSA